MNDSNQPNGGDKKRPARPIAAVLAKLRDAGQVFAEGTRAAFDAFLTEHLSPEVLEGLRRGELWLPSTVLEAGVSRAMPQDVKLRKLICLAEAIQPTVEVHRLGAALDVACTATVESIAINADHQEMVCYIKDIGLTGANWLGWFVAPFANVVLRHTYGDKLVGWGGSTDISIRPDPMNADRFTVDLANLPQVRRLKETKLLGAPLLAFVQIGGCRHAGGGFYLKGTIKAAGR